MVKSRVKRFSNDSKKNIVISDNDNESKDTYECDKCGEILVPPKDRKDNETLYCQVCGESYILE
jgi:formylmethanofuran dehydrogenase subunit E